MATRKKRTGDPAAAVELDEVGHIPEDTDPLVAAEWYVTNGQTDMAVLSLIRHANGGKTPGEAARSDDAGDNDTEE